ncbi:MAG: rhomboid family intramembrane serine protease [Deltaproteobacteria bacterium]|nr:rhomboid family intramembrane serine protease [Deltaproteobacteria bacterium]
MWSTRLAIVTFVLSVLLMGAHHMPEVVGLGLVKAFVFTPAEVKHGLVWQLVTYVFADPDPWGLVFTVYSLLVFGAGVEERVGSSAFLGWFFGLGLAGSLVTLGFSLFWARVADGSYLGATAVSLGLLVVWVALHRGALINFMMVLPMKAEVLLYLSLGMLVLYAIRTHPAALVPEFSAFFAGELATRSSFDLSPRRLWLRWRAHRIEQELRKRSSKFTVITGGDEPDDDEGTGTPGSGGYLN